MGGHPDDAKILKLLRGVIDDMEKRTRAVAEQVENDQLAQFFDHCAKDRAAVARQVDLVIEEVGAADVEIEREECCPLSDFQNCKAANESGNYGPLLKLLADCEDKNVAILKKELARDDLSAIVRLAMDEATLIAEKTATQYRRIAEQAAPPPISKTGTGD